MAEHEDLRAGRRLAVFAALDLGIGPAQPDAHHVDERFAVARRRVGHLTDLARSGPVGDHGERLHPAGG
ncbi:MAG: hypothetical protein AUG02_04845 [Chloroflexi bacterium 13_1_20CM_2_70_9]|nr:MAG: hypothetical protein AUG02_04845 [Chloroflexi bacterium 13_1_20CM_2_70_9]